MGFVSAPNAQIEPGHIEKIDRIARSEYSAHQSSKSLAITKDA